MANLNPFKVTALAAALAAAGAVTPAYALFDYQSGDFKATLDTTVSLGSAWRASNIDYRQVGDYNATAAYLAGDNPQDLHHLHGTSNMDDGDLFWKKGSAYSQVLKISADLELNYKNYGAFIRGKAFYDNAIVSGDGVTRRPAAYRQDANGNPLEPAQSAGRSADIMDAFIWGDWNIGNKPLNVRLGRQVINWGEGVFFADGINTINPIDVNALLTPGSEVKDALIPLNALYASLGLSDSVTLEGFVLFDWKQTQLPECGTFFSTSDLAGSNCASGYYPGGLEAGISPTDTANYLQAQATHLSRGQDKYPGKDGQFGAALRYYSDALQTEFAGYYIRYHSSVPLVGGHMPQPGLLGSIYPGIPSDLQGARTYLSTYGPNGPLSTFALFPTADYVLEYPKDIDLVGGSFNSTIDFGLPGGATAVSGELSWRRNQPYQIEDGITLAGLAGLPSVSCWETGNDCYAKYSAGEYVPGYIRDDYYQAEVSFVQFFDRILGAARWTAVLDIAGSYADYPGKDKTLLNGAYDSTLNVPGAPSNAVLTGSLAALFGGATQVPYNTLLNALYQYTGLAAAYPETKAYPTHAAWGYKMRFTGDYNNVFAGVNLHPIISFSHDVRGTTPGPISNFLENRKSLGLQLEADYLNTYTMKIGYTDFYGAEPYNQLADRDFYSLSLSASF